MLRNILGAVAIFALITGIAVWVAFLPEKAAAPPPPTHDAAPVAIMLEPGGDFFPRAAAPVFKVRANDLKSVYVRFYRLRDRALMLRLYRGITQGSLSPIAVARLLAETTTPGAAAWLALKNDTQDLAWPGIVAGGSMPSGFYLVTVAADATTDAQAASWFIRSDLHVIALNDADGWHALCQDLHARTITATLAWFGFDTTPVLADVPCNTADRIPPAAQIPPDAPLQLLFGEDTSGNLAFVPLRGAQKAAADPAEGGILTTERPHYLPGQTIMALARGAAFTGDKVAFALVQPNGLRVQEKPAPSASAQLAWIDFTLSPDAPQGIWRLIALKDGTVLRDIPIPVGEEPAGIKTGLRLIDRRDRNVILAARIADARDAPLPHRAATVHTAWTSVRQLPEVSPDYAFGGYDNPEQQPQTAASWISGGETIALQLPPPPPAPYPVQAQLRLEPWPAARISAAQTAHVVFPTQPWALGLRANFGDAPVPEDVKAEFRVALFKTKSTSATPPTLGYELVTEHRSFRWFFADGKWNYHSDVAAVTVARGDVKLDGNNKGQIGVTAPHGQYRLDVITSDRTLISSWRFQVGAPTPATVAPANLPLRLESTPDGKQQIATHGRGMMTMIAADAKLRALRTDAGSAARDVAFTLDAPTTTGMNVLVLAADAAATDAGGHGRGEIWLPPQTKNDVWGRAELRLPTILTAGTTIKIGAQFAARKDQNAFAQIIALPAAKHNDAELLSAARSTPQPRRFALASNIFPPGPTAFTPPPTEPTVPTATGSSRSNVVPIGADGKAELTLPLPDRAEPMVLHLLAWTADEVHEQTQNITLVPGAPAAASRPPAASPPTFAALNGWACPDPLTAKHPTLRLPPAAGPTFAVLSPVALPDLPEALSALLRPHHARTATTAHTLIALQDYSALLAARGVTPVAQQALRAALWAKIWQRQQSDGGVAAVPDTTVSDLNATATALRAWNNAAPDDADATRLAAMKNFLQRRLDNPWNAENELPGRADGFYALSLFGQTDAAALRYFVAKYGNQLRDAVREAELAAALRQIQDGEKSQAFSARAQAQLPSLRHADPGRAWQVLAIMAQHDMIPAEELAAQARALPQFPAIQPWFAAVTLHARAALARALPMWETELPGKSTIRERGLQTLAAFEKSGTQIRFKSGPPLYVCADHIAPPAAHSSVKIAPTLTRTLLTMTGSRVAPTALQKGARYILIVGGKNWHGGPGEINIPLPPGLAYRAAVPGAAIVGAVKWLSRTDAIAAATTHAHGVTLAIERGQNGDGRIAVLVEAQEKTRIDWPPVTLTQSQGIAVSSGGTLTIR